jgi:2-oxo-4-hydroxy-4-carboxy-5-ureidoimidazoline decarboxylase
MRLDEFNASEPADAASVVSVWAAIPEWVDRLVADRPYPSVEALAQHATERATRWTSADLDAALAHHPRIGQRVSGSSAEATASRGEQASMSSATDAVADAIAQGNAAYEQRFGRVFLIRAAGRSPREILDHLDRRLRNDETAETAEATAQLAEIALLRLRTTIETGDPE